MAALTETQLQSACRAKLPVTVVVDEDYTTMTPAEIKAAWPGWGGDGNVWVQDLAGQWTLIGADLPCANERGWHITGGGEQYTQRTDFADVTVGQAFPWPWTIYPNGNTIVCSAKGTIDGLPYVEATVSGTPTLTWGGLCAPPGYLKVPHESIETGELISIRAAVEIVALSTTLDATSINLWQAAASPPNTGSMAYTSGIGLRTAELWLTDIGQAIEYWGFELKYTHSLTEYSQNSVFKIFPSLITVQMAVPAHVHYPNTSTTSARTIAPEIAQREWTYDGPLVLEIELETPPRNLGQLGNYYTWSANAGEDELLVYQDTIDRFILRVKSAGTQYVSHVIATVNANTTVKVVVYQTSQTTTCYVNGTLAVSVPSAPVKATLESLGHSRVGGQQPFATFKSYKRRRGLATPEHLIEWSGAA